MIPNYNVGNRFIGWVHCLVGNSDDLQLVSSGLVSLWLKKCTASFTTSCLVLKWAWSNCGSHSWSTNTGVVHVRRVCYDHSVYLSSWIKQGFGNFRGCCSMKRFQDVLASDISSCELVWLWYWWWCYDIDGDVMILFKSCLVGMGLLHVFQC
jgi:hypothetical protein